MKQQFECPLSPVRRLPLVSRTRVCLEVQCGPIVKAFAGPWLHDILDQSQSNWIACATAYRPQRSSTATRNSYAGTPK
jgi:hypothetical protein